MRIGIIGAGPSGLTAAETLKAKGYTDITVLEKAEQAGGKCCSIEHEGRSYELGAGVLSGNNVAALDIAKKHGVEFQQVDFSSPSIRPKQTLRHKLELAKQVLFVYRPLAQRFKNAAKPGFANINAELCEPFSIWAKKHDLHLVAQEFALYFTGYGYGFLDEVPAAYVLKYYSWDLIAAFLKKQIYKFPGGIQHLWTTVAKAHHVIYGTTVRQIKRGETVVVTTDKDTFEFDALILTAPLDDALGYLDGNEDEKELFPKIQYCDYRTYACLLKGFPRKSGYILENTVSARLGHPVFWYQRYADTDLTTFYLFGDWQMTDEEAQKNIEHVVKAHGGRIERVMSASHWKYFPHISATDMKNGYFNRLESLQGKNRTYYAGEVMNFSSVGLSAEYSKNLIERFF